MVLTVGPVGTGSVWRPGDVTVRAWSGGSLEASGGLVIGGVGSFSPSGGCLGVVGCGVAGLIWAAGLV